MKKVRSYVVLALVVIVLTATAHAEQWRTCDVYPSLTFSNYVASCDVDIYANSSSDAVSATMELWRGTTKLNSWSTSGTYHVSMQETENVTRFRTYRLVVNYKVNGVDQPTVEISQYYG